MTTHFLRFIMIALLLALAGVAFYYKGAEGGRARWFLFIAMGVSGIGARGGLGFLNSRSRFDKWMAPLSYAATRAA